MTPMQADTFLENLQSTHQQMLELAERKVAFKGTMTTQEGAELSEAASIGREYVDGIRQLRELVKQLSDTKVPVKFADKINKSKGRIEL